MCSNKIINFMKSIELKVILLIKLSNWQLVLFCQSISIEFCCYCIVKKKNEKAACFHSSYFFWFDINIYVYDDVYTKNRGAWNGAVTIRSKRICVFELSVKPSVLLKLLEQYGCPSTSAPQKIFSISIQLKLR